MTVWFNETAIDTDLTLLSAHTSDSGGTWVQCIGPSPQIFATAVSGKSLIGPGPSGSYSVWRTSVIAPNADAKIPFTLYTYTLVSFTGVGLRVSGTGTATRGYVGIFNTSSSKLEIWKLDSNGQLTGLPLASSAAITLAASTSYTGEFSVVGSLLTLSLGSDSVNFTDTTISAAGYAITVFGSSQGTGIFIDAMAPQDIATAATAVTMTGPSGGNVGAASANFTVGANGTITGTVIITPSSGGGGGTFSPATVSISSGSPTGTFTYTPASNGAKTISVTNNGSLTNPSSITYTANAVGTPTPGVTSLVSTTTTTINVSATAASGGTAPLTYQWHRSTTANFTPGGVNALSGSTSLSLADSASLIADTPYFYVCRVTDAVALTGDSNQVAGVLKAASLAIGFIGDSITAGFGLIAGLDPVTQIAPILSKLYKNRAVVISNRGVSGSKTGDWLSGSANLIAAKAAFVTAGVSKVHIMLGANDAAAAYLVTATAYKTNLQNIIADLTGAGYSVILSYPTYIPAGANSNATTAASVALAESYQTQIDSLVNATTVFRGDVLSFNYFIGNLSEYQSDLTHPTAAGALALAQMWARGIERNVFGIDRPVPTKAIAVTFATKAGAIQASLTGLKWEWSDVLGVVIDSGTGAMTNGSGVFSVTSVHTYLPVAGVGYLKVTNSSGAVNTTDFSFHGAVAVA